MRITRCVVPRGWLVLHAPPPVPRRCDCALAEDECTDGMWTSACSWCVGPIPDGPEGCYDTSEHKCDCDISEADCKIPHVWTEGCASCSSSSARTPAVGLAAIR